MARSSLLITYAGALALAIACSASERDPASDLVPDDGSAPEPSSGGRSSALGGTSGHAGGAKVGADASGSSAAGRQGGLAGKPEASSGGVFGIIPAGGAGGEVEPSVLPGACTNDDSALLSEAGVLVKLRANSNEPGEFPKGEVQISNASGSSLPLESLELRYYITSEHSPEQTDQLVVTVDDAQKRGREYANVAADQVLTDVVLIDESVSRSDAFVRIGFVGGSGQEGMLRSGETLVVQYRVHPPNEDNAYYQVPRDQTNDYSFGACPEYASTWPRMVLLLDGELASGDLPEGLLPPSGAGAGGQGGAGSFGEGGLGGAGGAG